MIPRRRSRRVAPRVVIRTPRSLAWRLGMGGAGLALAAVLAAGGYQAGRRAAPVDAAATCATPAVDPLTDPGTAPTRKLVADSANQALLKQLHAAEAELGQLRADLAFFDTLLPASGHGGLQIRNFRVTVGDEAGAPLHYRLLLQGAPAAGQALRFIVTGVRGGRPATVTLPPAPVPAAASSASAALRAYRRVEGELKLPADVGARHVTVEVMQGAQVVASLTADVGT